MAHLTSWSFRAGTRSRSWKSTSSKNVWRSSRSPVIVWCIKLFFTLRGAWVTQSVKHPTLAQVMVLQSVSSSPVSGSEPGDCFGICVSPCLCSSPTHALSLSVSQKWINVFKKLKEKKKESGICLTFAYFQETHCVLSIFRYEQPCWICCFRVLVWYFTKRPFYYWNKIKMCILFLKTWPG